MPRSLKLGTAHAQPSPLCLSSRLCLCKDDKENEEEQGDEGDVVQQQRCQRDRAEDDAQRRKDLKQGKHQLEGLCERQDVSQAAGNPRAQA